VAFRDLTKAFDLVSRSGLFVILSRFGCPGTLLSIILKLHDDMHATVQVDDSISRHFPLKGGVKQGCLLAPTLFAIFLNALLIGAFPKPSGVLLHCVNSGNCLIYPVFVQSPRSDNFSSENCSMRTMLSLWQPPHPPFKTFAAPSLVPMLNLTLIKAWLKP